MESISSLATSLTSDKSDKKSGRVGSASGSRPKSGKSSVVEKPIEVVPIKKSKKMEDSAKNKSSTGVAFDNRYIITGSMDGVLRIWDCLFDER